MLFSEALVRDEHQLFGMGYGQRSQQQAIDDAEDRDICAAADRDRKHGGRGEQWRSAQLTQEVPHVLPGMLDGQEALLFPVRV